MIVVAIIGILAATAMPATHVSYAAKSTVRESIHSVNALQQEIESYFLQHQVFPAHNRDISAKILADLKLRNVKDLSISTGGRIVITYVSRLNFSYPNYYTLDSTDKTLVLKPTFDKHVFVWDYCSEGSVPAEFRGKPCFI
ncbi:MAG: hypothetical protein GQ582_05710 [Methyloprofundus sp.]|nr:hypothetical protein [Methyloprofundus sp.]